MPTIPSSAPTWSRRCKDSAERMNDLLARLSQHHARRAEEPRAGRRRARWSSALAQAAPRAASGRSVRACAPRSRSPIRRGSSRCSAISSRTRSRRARRRAGHASRSTHDAGRWRSRSIDRGCGMIAAFVRDELFKPFASTKPGGFGIGAFEARQLAAAMGGRSRSTTPRGRGHALPRRPRRARRQLAWSDAA